MSDETTSGNAEQSERVAGVGMFVAAFVDELAAEGALKRMKEAKRRNFDYGNKLSPQKIAFGVCRQRLHRSFPS